MIWLTIPWMAFMSAASGGNPKIPLGLAQWLLAAPYLIFYSQLGFPVIGAYLSAVVFLRTGHGRAFHYQLPFKPGSKPEKIEAIIPDFWPVWVQKMSIALLTGLGVTLVLSVSLAIMGHYASAGILALSGALKASAYAVRSTERAEVLRGVFLGCGVVGAWYCL